MTPPVDKLRNLFDYNSSLSECNLCDFLLLSLDFFVFHFPLSPFCPSRLIIFLIQLEIRIYGATFGGAYFLIKLLFTSDRSESQVAAPRQRHAIFVFNSEIVFMIL